MKETNEHIAIWEGEKLTKEQAFETSGIKTVCWLDEMEKIIESLVTNCETFTTITMSITGKKKLKTEMKLSGRRKREK